MALLPARRSPTDRQQVVERWSVTPHSAGDTPRRCARSARRTGLSRSSSVAHQLMALERKGFLRIEISTPYLLQRCRSRVLRGARDLGRDPIRCTASGSSASELSATQPGAPTTETPTRTAPRHRPSPQEWVRRGPT
ncbi:hypothetical protein [Streptomyces sp. NPDC002187]|uniref:LexA family protein n=1 Tax=Streptomyces sp. NPDC002187 TaxID=3364637 RepID=UPI00368DA40F